MNRMLVIVSVRKMSIVLLNLWWVDLDWCGKPYHGTFSREQHKMSEISLIEAFISMTCLYLISARKSHSHLQLIPNISSSWKVVLPQIIVHCHVLGKARMLRTQSSVWPDGTAQPPSGQTAMSWSILSTDEDFFWSGNAQIGQWWAHDVHDQERIEDL